MIKKKHSGISFCLLFLFLALGCSAIAPQPTAPEPAAEFIQEPIDDWQIIALDLAGQVKAFLADKKDLRIKPVCIDFQKDTPFGETLYAHLHSALPANEIPVVQNGRDALKLKYQSKIIEKNGSADSMASLEYTALGARIFVVRDVAPNILADPGPEEKTSESSVKNGNSTSLRYQKVLLTNTLSYMNHPFMEQTNLYVIRRSDVKSNIEEQPTPTPTPEPTPMVNPPAPKTQPIPEPLPSPTPAINLKWDLRPPSESEPIPAPTQVPVMAPPKPKKKGRTFHVVD